MAQEHTFDVVSRVNLQEVRNALQQAQKEIATRFDFKGSSAGAIFDEAAKTLKVTADHHVQCAGVVDIVQTKLAKRGVLPKAFVWGTPEQLPSGGVKQSATLQQGLSAEQARAITKAIKELGLKVQPRIDADAVRVSGKQVDDLQVVITAIKLRDFGISLQFENYR